MGDEAQTNLTALLIAHRDMIEAQAMNDRAAEVEAVGRVQKHRAALARRTTVHDHEEGKHCEACRLETVACLRGLLDWLSAPIRWMRSLKVCEWMAIAMVFIAVCAVVAK